MLKSDVKFAEGVSLTIFGATWLFFSICMPPLAFAVTWIGLETGLPLSLFGRWLVWVDSAVALCAIGFGVYLAACQRSPKASTWKPHQ
jgi:hypothetical protein